MNTNSLKFQMIYGGVVLFGIVVVVATAFILITLAGYGQLVIGLCIGLLPTSFLWYSENKKEKREHRDWLMRNEKAYVSELADCFFVVVKRTKENSINLAKVQSELFERFEDIRAAMALWGSTSILRLFQELQEANFGNLSADQRNMKADEFLRGLRKELGHDDSSLEPGDLVSFLARADAHHEMKKSA